METRLDLPETSRGRSRTSSGKGAAEQEHLGKVFPTVKAVAILETMATAKRPLSVAELCVLLGLPKPTAHRIVRMLESESLLQREPGTRRLVPGARLVRLGLELVTTSMQQAPRRAILEALSQQVGETCNFGVMAGSHVVYIDRVEAAWPFGLRFEPGSRVPLHCTSIGKLFLSQFSPRKRALMLESIELHPYTDNTITDPAKLEQELQKIRRSGASIDNQEFLAGVVCVAVPVHGPNGQPVAAIAVSAPAVRMTVEKATQHVPLMKAAATRLSSTIATDHSQFGEAASRKPEGAKA
ncbi:MAG: IclR family transcriptional regulator [Pseudolabrys sp.]